MTPVKPEIITDIKTDSVIIRILPKSAQPYALLARLDRPVGWWLLLLPGWWAIALAGGGIARMTIEHWMLMFLFFIGAIMMRAAGCVINDLWDRNLDQQVERTRMRPIASGAISPKNALIFLCALLMGGFLILITLSHTAIILGLAVVPLIVLYPLMKRITYWPQAFLGVTFNFGALMGWAAVTGTIETPAILLYIGGIFWTLGYDTIYAHQDKDDDLIAGIKSTALKLGAYAKSWVSGFYIIAMTCLGLAVISMATSIFSLLLLIPPIVHMAMQLDGWSPHNSSNALRIFKSNRNFGLLMLAACFFA
jgi:4-hydroxybenzoate polyprenyltransferase